MEVEALKKLIDDGKMEPYIRHIKFPKYKNLTPGLSIELSFPITAIVGANGSSKSSIIKALFGCPDGYSVGRYWFSTSTDPIKEDSSGLRNCYIYGYKNTYRDDIAEVFITRISKPKNPDYWEPSRPVKKVGMSAFPSETLPGEEEIKLATRWKNINKNVVMLDFRSSLSAYDKCVYINGFKKTKTIKSIQSFIRKRSPHLRKALDNNSTSYSFGGTERIPNGKNIKLPDEHVQQISKILDKDYESIQLIEHTFFGVIGETARIIESGIAYTEAFAGSGEFAVINIVSSIINAPPNSLILLDEPEVSIHPGAQEKLMEFFSQQVFKNKHQFIFTTHSPALIRQLPPEGIKVLNYQKGLVDIKLQKALPEEAFMQIGEPTLKKPTIFVEDRLAKELILKTLRIHNPAFMKLLEIIHVPGGCKSLIKSYMVPYSIENRDNVFFFLDGDQFNRPFPSKKEINSLEDNEVFPLVRKIFGMNIDFVIDGGKKRQEQKLCMARNFLIWCYDKISYLPELTPEHFIIKKLYSDQEVTDPKEFFKKMAHRDVGLSADEAPSGNEIFGTQIRELAKIRDDEPELLDIFERITSIFTKK